MKSHNLSLKLIIPSLLLPLLVGCATTPDTEVSSIDQQSETPVKNEYPTQTRVEYVLQCMQRNGGQSYNTLYSCVCSVDKIAEAIAYDDFTEAQTFTYLRSTPGENGAVFRDPPRAKLLRKQLKEAEQSAKATCFVKQVSKTVN